MALLSISIYFVYGLYIENSYAGIEDQLIFLIKHGFLFFYDTA